MREWNSGIYIRPLMVDGLTQRWRKKKFQIYGPQPPGKKMSDSMVVCSECLLCWSGVFQFFEGN